MFSERCEPAGWVNSFGSLCLFLGDSDGVLSLSVSAILFILANLSGLKFSTTPDKSLFYDLKMTITFLCPHHLCYWQ